GEGAIRRVPEEPAPTRVVPAERALAEHLRRGGAAQEQPWPPARGPKVFVRLNHESSVPCPLADTPLRADAQSSLVAEGLDGVELGRTARGEEPEADADTAADGNADGDGLEVEGHRPSQNLGH